MNCRAALTANILVLENSHIRREFRWNGGNIITRGIVDRVSSQEWISESGLPDCQFPHENGEIFDGALDVQPCIETSLAPAHLRATVTFRINALEIRRVFRIYPECPTLACDFYLRGKSAAAWRSTTAESRTRLSNDFQAPILERFPLRRRHVRLRAVRFYDATDHRNNLVHAEDFLPYRIGQGYCGNLLLGQLLLDDGGFFILKESPCSGGQLAYPGYDFVCDENEIRLVGLGLDPGDLQIEQWTRAYSFVTGVAAYGEGPLLQALRAYQDRVRIRRPDRDEMTLVNTLGDYGQDKHLGEAFALAELDACARLGVSHFQLDDGWQKGQSSNNATDGGGGGVLDGIWTRSDYWDVHPTRFPNGLAPVVERAKTLGIEVCVWFNPSQDNSYAHWEDDASVLTGLFQKFGIRMFKIAGVVIGDKTSDIRLRAMLDRVVMATNGQAVFNLDITAGKRCGYHYMNEYGNLFLENRYTDWSNYYPHWTLRNLWTLARYVPSQNLQIECLNKWRNVDKYPPDDKLAPHKCPFDYIFAVTMMAQPLCWFEASQLPEEAFTVATLIKTYRAHQARIHSGQILPIGAEPCGAAWTGFQSLRGDAGYFLVFREHNTTEHGKLSVWLTPGETVVCEAIAGAGKTFTGVVDVAGQLEFRLAHPLSFALYSYVTQASRLQSKHQNLCST
ncbi:MAG: alpha-galactosidase [Planctomycetota bacterium]